MRLLFSPNPIKTLPIFFFRSLSPYSPSSLLFKLSNSFNPFSFSSPFQSTTTGISFPSLRSASSSSPTIMTTTASSKLASSSSAIVSNNEVGISRRFWIKSCRESIFALYTPFVICLAAGNLKLDSFRHYIAQDVHFLKAFAQAYQFAEDCADDDDDKSAISELRERVLEELKIHDSFVQEWGLDLALESPPNSATVKYRDFLLATASGKVEGIKAPGKLATPFERTKVAAYILGAMTPCMRLYAFIGKELQALLNPDDNSHPYKKWIDNYSSEGFQESALQTEDLLDKLSVSLTREELDVIEKLYRQAMNLEIGFFTAQSLMQRIVVPLLKELDPVERRLILFSDFDLTCTVVDSSAVLAEIAIVTAHKGEQNQSESQIARMASADLRNSFGVLSKQYTEEYEQCIDSVLSAEKAEEFNYDGLYNALRLLSDFEKKANARVIESGLLKGVNLEEIKKAGGHMILQDGCISFFQNILQNENLDLNIHVLSYCWCDDLIRSAFSSGNMNMINLHVICNSILILFYAFAHVTIANASSGAGGVKGLNVHANEFIYDGSISTGDIVKKVESPIDKLEAFSEISQKFGSDKKSLSVYIGDSVGDLLCLLKADVGLVIGSSTSLRKVGSHFGVKFVPLFEGLVAKQKEYVEGHSFDWKGLSGTLYTVSSWAEIHAFILGA